MGRPAVRLKPRHSADERRRPGGSRRPTSQGRLWGAFRRWSTRDRCCLSGRRRERAHLRRCDPSRRDHKQGSRRCWRRPPFDLRASESRSIDASQRTACQAIAMEKSSSPVGHGRLTSMFCNERTAQSVQHLPSRRLLSRSAASSARPPTPATGGRRRLASPTSPILLAHAVTVPQVCTRAVSG